MQDYLLSLAKVHMVKDIWATYRAEKVKGRRGLPLMVLAQRDAGLQSCSGHNVLSVPKKQGLPTGVSQSPSAFPPLKGPLFPRSVILLLLWPSPAFCLATSHLEGSKAAEMCITDGRNYVAHLTSEIFFPFSSLTLSLFHKLLQDWGN